MSDFAKASMVGLIVHRLRQTNPELLRADAHTADVVRSAHVAAKAKRDFLDLIWRQAGPETLLSIGQGNGRQRRHPSRSVVAGAIGGLEK